jgi:mRNA interferase RelE/StbE
MKYSVSFTKEAESDIDFFYRADKRLFRRILNKIESLQNNPFEGKALIGNHKGEYSFRIGNYRIVYMPSQKEKIIYILTIKHRKHVY